MSDPATGRYSLIGIEEGHEKLFQVLFSGQPRHLMVDGDIALYALLRVRQQLVSEGVYRTDRAALDARGRILTAILPVQLVRETDDGPTYRAVFLDGGLYDVHPDNSFYYFELNPEVDWKAVVRAWVESGRGTFFLPDGYYWRRFTGSNEDGSAAEYIAPVEVAAGRYCGCWDDLDMPVEDDGRWLGPCVPPETCTQ